ncbi:flagellar hook-basal body complex protein [Malaciobacter mytili]|uniref:flagellar hook-basal body complex protein n=1 Tax=Malaciobacter mytili TaxID=603050 RepID=UPI003BB1BEF0
MISGLWNGISGLGAFEKALSAESNNVANVNTIGHKSDDVTFQDLMYQAGYGKGVNIQTVEKDFSQGNLKLTGNSYDVAIDGRGFFLVRELSTNQVFYTRAGNFKMGSDGTLQSIDGMKVQGIQSMDSTIIATDPTDTQFNSTYNQFIASRTISNNDFIQTINARATDFTKTAQASGISGQGYKSASSKINDIQALITNYKDKLELYSSDPNATSVDSVSAVTQVPFNNFVGDLDDENDLLQITINNITVKQKFDTDAQTTMNKFADKISEIQGVTATVDANGLLTINSLVPGKDLKVTYPSLNDQAPAVNEIVTPVVGSGMGLVTSAREALKNALENAGAKLLDMTTNLDLTARASLVTTDLQLKLDKLNISDNGLGNISIENGQIFAKDGDNKFIIGAISTAYFNDELSLNPEGNNLFSKTTLSGDAIDASKANKLQGKTLELSNSNFGTNLTNLMVYQRAFEANSKAVTTSDEFLKTAIQLKQ